MNIKQQQLWILATTLVLASCTESFKPDVSTETGNPPAIDGELVALVVTSDEVHVRGEAGAATPPEGEVEVTVVRTQAVTNGPIEDDGSFDVQVQASIDDVFEVRAVLGDQRSPAVIVIRGGAQVGEGDGGVLSCEQKVELARMVFDEAFAAADTTCVTDADCNQVYGGTGCFSGCPKGYLSDDGVVSLNAAVESIDTGLCEGYEPACGELWALPCVAQPEPTCEGGQCTVSSGVNNGGCESCLSSEIHWRVTSPGILPAEISLESFELTGCNDLTRRDAGGVASCTVQVPQCPNPFGGTAISSILSVLADADVQAAFAEGGTYGQHEESSGFVYDITVGDDTIIYRTCAGEGASVPPCEPAGALEDLRLLLDGARTAYSCGGEPTNDCTSDFEGGSCDALFHVWWHDPQSGVCVSREYGGCDGNGNRYESEDACRAACPAPTSQSDCAPGRAFTEDLCFGCGPIATCTNPTNACLLECETTAECEGEPASAASDTAECQAETGLCFTPPICF